MPFKSMKQNAWAHTPAGIKALGGKAKVKEWESKTDYKNLPMKKKRKAKRIDVRPPAAKGWPQYKGMQMDKGGNMRPKNNMAKPPGLSKMKDIYGLGAGSPGKNLSQMTGANSESTLMMRKGKKRRTIGKNKKFGMNDQSQPVLPDMQLRKAARRVQRSMSKVKSSFKR